MITSRPNDDALGLARSLEAIGRALGGTLGAEMLVYAADLLLETDREPALADALLTRALKSDPSCRIALDRTLRAAAARGDWLVLSEALATAVDLVASSEAQATLMAQRAEVLGRRLGRFEESQALYVEAARRSPSLAAAALAASEDVELRQAGRMAHEAPWPEVVWSQPAFDPLIAAGMPVPGGPDPALDRFRAQLAEKYDGAILRAAVADGIERGNLDVVRRVLPGMSAEGRMAALERLIVQAEGRGDEDEAARLRTAAFAEAPTSDAYYEAARALFMKGPFVEARFDVLLRRRRVVNSPAEMESLLSELAELAADAGIPAAAAEAHLEVLRMPHVQDWADVLSAVDRLSVDAQDRRIWSRALAAAAARPRLDPAAHRQLLSELARVLEDELHELGSATAVRAEIAVSSPPTAPRPSPVTRPPPPPIDPEDVDALTVRQAWQRGDLPTAVRLLENAALSPSVTCTLWQRIAETAEVLGQDELARLAFVTAGVHATVPKERTAAQAGRARVAARMGAKREAAVALAGVADAAKAARAHLAARDVGAARAAFGRALDQDPADVEAAAQLVRMHAEDGNRRTVEQLADTMAGHPMSDDRRAVWLTELALAWHRLGDVAGAHRDLIKAMRLDVANTSAAEGLVVLAADVRESAWMDDALSSLRARWAAQGEWLRAFLAAAVLVGRGRASAADTLTYERLRIRFSHQPQSALPPGWLGRWLGLVPALNASSSTRTGGGEPWQLQPGLSDVVGTVQALFRAPEPHWFEDDGAGIRMGAGPVLIVGRKVPRWRRRWRFEVGRALAALVEPRLAPGLERTDGAPTMEQLVVDRAGLVAVGDPAIALAALGSHEPRGWRLVPFAVSEALVSMWKSVGMGIPGEGGLGLMRGP